MYLISYNVSLKVHACKGRRSLGRIPQGARYVFGEEAAFDRAGVRWSLHAALAGGYARSSSSAAEIAHRARVNPLTPSHCLNREQTMEKRTIALQSNAEVFGGNTITPIPLLLQAGPLLGEDLPHDAQEIPHERTADVSAVNNSSVEHGEFRNRIENDLS